jgi:putative SOS response-associated peptidase YedK
VLAVRHLPQAARPEFVNLRWELIPHWADDPKIGYSLINARAETAATKPAFRTGSLRKSHLLRSRNRECADLGYFRTVQ